jgi:hypothetical protein
MPNVFADSRPLNQDTKQVANCDTVGAASPVSDSCNQRAANNVNNGVTTAVPTAAKPTGTLLINQVCRGGQMVVFCVGVDITVNGNNPRPSSFSFGSIGSQLVTLGPGSFQITETINPIQAFVGFRTEMITGDCTGGNISRTQAQLTGTISAGQHLTCNIQNRVNG